MVQLEALLQGEVCVGQNPAQRELQHSQSTLLVIIEHLGSVPVTKQPGPTAAATSPLAPFKSMVTSISMYCASVGLWSCSGNLGLGLGLAPVCSRERQL